MRNRLPLPHFSELILTLLLCAAGLPASAQDREAELQSSFENSASMLLKRYCWECHSPELSEADIDLTSLQTWEVTRKSTPLFQRLLEQIRTGQMPPPDSPQPTDSERLQLQQWLEHWLAWRAETQAGDPGPVVLRRLNNAEYTYTLRDLTGIENLDPAREFPVDSAAGEGFSNTGASLVMSPAMVRKVLDAAKEITEHLVFLPDRIAFETNPSRSDMTNSKLEEIRHFYAQFTDQHGGDTVNLQGIVFETNQGGRLPIERYLKATLELRDALRAANLDSSDPATDPSTLSTWIHQWSVQQQLNPKYVSELWRTLQSTATTPATVDTLGQEGRSQKEESNRQTSTDSGLLESLRRSWKQATVDDHQPLLAEVLGWQRSLWRFTSVGHIGKVNGPKAWQEPVDPIRPSHEIRYAIPKAPTQPVQSSDVTLYLQISDAGDGAEGDVAVLHRPRLVAPGRPDLLLRDLPAIVHAMESQRTAWVSQTDEALNWIADWLDRSSEQPLSEFAAEAPVPPALLEAWANYLGANPAQSNHPGSNSSGSNRIRFTQKIENLSGYAFVQGWGAEDALSIIANASNDAVRVPGNMPPKSIAVHPSPSRGVCVAWRAPEKLTGQCSAMIRHAHTECGNGVAWRLELRRGLLRQSLASGFSNAATPVPIGPFQSLLLRQGDELVLVVEPRDGNHSCDLTQIELEVVGENQTWKLTDEVVGDILSGNPHADPQGRPNVWDFFSEPVAATGPLGTSSVIPNQSLLSMWFNEPDPSLRKALANQLEQRIVNATNPTQSASADTSPDALLVRQIHSSSGPLFAAAMHSLSLPQPLAPAATTMPTRQLGIEGQRFGGEREGVRIADEDCCVDGPTVLAIRVPAYLAEGTELVSTGTLHPAAGRNGSIQFSIAAERPSLDTAHIPKTTVKANDANWTTPSRQILVASPIVVISGSPAERRIQTSFAEFRRLFPIALCYTKIVPVDEVVTLTLFYREDEHLQRLMLTETQSKSLDRLWNELHFVSQDALKLVDAYEQLWQYATQDADPSAFEPLRQPILDRAEAFRQNMLDAEPLHLDWALQFASHAYRRPLIDAEKQSLRRLYENLRRTEIAHEEAIRLVVSRILVSPEFLYRLESPGPSDQPHAISDFELANRLSYFLWSSAPDAELLQCAIDGKLQDDRVLADQARRMLGDPRTGRMAIEFGCMWLHIRDLDQLDEKSETHFPEFQEIRHDLYRESILFIADTIQNGGSVMDFLTADHTFLNERLAKYYGIPDVMGPEWRRVEGVRAFHRGGILTMGSTLSKQSGASRTSPILRGNWLSEVILGEKLPKPPKNIPVLAELPPEGQTERQLIERHSNDPACSKCHQRIDPFGFALEAYDAIGRFRTMDALGLAIDTQTELPDGTQLRNLEDLREYLATQRSRDFIRQFNRKLLGYALGRSIQLSDEPILASIYQQQQETEYQLADTIVSIILSPPFRQIRGREYRDEFAGSE